MKTRKKAKQGAASGKVSEVRKLSKTERKPSTMFAGMLNTKDRTFVFEEAAKVVSREKRIEETDFRLRKFVEQAVARMGGQE